MDKCDMGVNPVVFAQPICSLQIVFAGVIARVIYIKFPLQPDQKYYITQYEELGFS